MEREAYATPARPSQALASLTLAPLTGFVQAAPLWQRLDAASENPFSCLEFSQAWWRHYGAEHDLRLTVARDADGEEIAILPLVAASDDAGETLRFAGYREADLLGPVSTREHFFSALRALADEIRRGPATIRFIGDDLPEKSAAALGAPVAATMASHVLELSPRFDDLLMRLSANHRAQVRARERRLRRSASVRIREADSSTLEADLETLFSLHQARWRGRSRVFRGVNAAFHHDFAHAAYRRGWLRLRVLEVDGRAAAANYAFKVGAAEWYYQAGRDPQFDRASAGTVLQAGCIRAAIEEGTREYRWLRGDEAYKLRWPNREELVETVVIESGAVEATRWRRPR